jgi:hypothetical protein
MVEPTPRQPWLSVNETAVNPILRYAESVPEAWGLTCGCAVVFAPIWLPLLIVVIHTSIKILEGIFASTVT